MCRGFSHFSYFLHHYVMEKLATSSTRVNILPSGIFLSMLLPVISDQIVRLLWLLCGDRKPTTIGVSICEDALTLMLLVANLAKTK